MRTHAAIVRLSPWTNHHNTCARVTHAGDCDCGLQAALAAIETPTRTTLARLICEAEEDRAGLCTQFDGCWHCQVLDVLRVIERREAGYSEDPIFTTPVDGSDEAIRLAAIDTASRLGLFAATWPEFYAFGLAVKKAHEQQEQNGNDHQQPERPA